MKQADAVRHPAKFTDSILEAAFDMLGSPAGRTLYDPFAGVGKGVDYFAALGWESFGTELEPEWAAQSERVVCCDSLAYMRERAPHIGGPYSTFPVGCVFTSPAYGNRMADHHEAKDDSRRNTYRHSLGRPLSDNSSAGMQWGDEYRTFHTQAWALVYQVLKPGGYFLLNVKDHIRKGEVQSVVDWHREVCTAMGFTQERHLWVGTPSNRQGQNGEKRVDHEDLVLFSKPAA